MKFVPTLLAGVSSAVLFGCASTETPSELQSSIASTESGLVRGTGNEVKRFAGIPYAAAPVSSLRWKPPQPAKPWAGTRDATSFGDYCTQPQEYPEQRGAMSEDCLNLNVWTPAKRSTDKLPVIVWIHGGGFTYGAGSHPSYDGQALASRGAVVVTINYRLGLLGFFAHPQLTAESPERASGNYGLMDQAAALRWVQRNIASFGGDAGNVTIMGQSAGAHSISTLITSDLAKGSFHKAIMQSVGVMRPTMSLKEAERYGQEVGADIASLRALPAANFLELQKKLGGGHAVAAARALSIVQDGYVVKLPDYQAYASGRFSKVQVLVGNNANEGGGATKNWPYKTAAEFQKLVRGSFPGKEDAAWSAYRVSSDDKVPQAMADLYSDAQFLFGTRELLTRYQQYGLTSYRYIFTRHRNEAASAPIHGDELQFGFDNLSAQHRGRYRPFDATDSAIAKSMANAWVRFARTGNPNGPGLPAWQPYSTSQQAYMEFGSVPRPGTGYGDKGIDFLRDYFVAERR